MPANRLRKIQSPLAGDCTRAAGSVACERCPKANNMPLTATQLAAIPNAMAARTVKNKVAKLTNKLKVRPTRFPAAPHVEDAQTIRSDASAAEGAADYFFFSAFHTVRDMARPQNGQKFIKYSLGRSSGEATA